MAILVSRKSGFDLPTKFFCPTGVWEVEKLKVFSILHRSLNITDNAAILKFRFLLVKKSRLLIEGSLGPSEIAFQIEQKNVSDL